MEVVGFVARGMGWAIKALFVSLFWLFSTLGRTVYRVVKPRSTTFGSARWAHFREILFSGTLGGNGLIVGRTRWGFLRFNRDGYALLFAPTRSGKGTGIVVPNLLTYQGSVICTDPKGENHAITGRWRTKLGKVVTLNATRPELSDRFNPLDMVRIGTYHEADDALELAKLLVIPDSSNGGHWDNRATQLIQNLILYVCLRYRDQPELRNLAKVRSLVALGASELKAVLEDAQTVGSTSLREGVTAFRANADSEETKSVMSNVDKALSLWAADRPCGMISLTSTFDFRDFNRKVMTCYLIVDEGKLAIYAGFLRVMMGCMLMAMTRAKEEAPPKVPTLLLLDEAAAMGRIEPLETGIGYLASYARLLLVFQDLDQLERTYPKARSMVANAACQIAFNVNDISTAKMLADSIGQRTITSHSAGQSRHHTNLIDHQRNENMSEASRYLIDPSELMRLHPSRSIVFMKGAVRHPIRARKIRYHRNWRWRARWDTWRPARGEVVPFPATDRAEASDVQPAA